MATTTKKAKGLGMGLEALLGPRAAGGAQDDAGDTPSRLRLEQLQPGKYQPRTRMDEGALYELADSIRAQGVMQPILVRRTAGSERYEVIAGERRLRAAQLAGLDTIPVLVRDVPDETAAAMALIENMQREDLNPLEEARGIARLVDEFKLSHEQAAQAVGRSRSAASNLMRLLHLAPEVQALLLAGDLDMGHARALLPLEARRQTAVAHDVVARKLSVREAERLVNKALLGEAAAPAPQRTVTAGDREVARIEQALSDLLTAPVEIRIGRRGAGAREHGEVAIRFTSLDELHGLLQRLGHRGD